jgi:hypothetical protein
MFLSCQMYVYEDGFLYKSSQYIAKTYVMKVLKHYNILVYLYTCTSTFFLFLKFDSLVSFADNLIL